MKSLIKLKRRYLNKKLLSIIVLGLLLSGNAYADWLVIVKNEIDKNVFIKRTKFTEENAINLALEGCHVLYRHREDITNQEKLNLKSACYVDKIIEQ